MLYKNIETNIAGDDFIKLQEGKWEIGIFQDNPGLENINNSDFYKDVDMDKLKDKEEPHLKRCLKNKINVKLVDGQTKYAHIIHWTLSDPNTKFFCITFSINITCI